jgi:hypothetical protein
MTTKITRSNIASTGVAAGSYSAADITVNSSGQVTSASTSSIAASGGGGPKISGVAVTDNAWNAIDDTAVDVLGGYIKITGTGFSSGCLVYFNQTPASSVSFVSSTELRVTTGALTAGTYVVYAINTDGGVAISVPGVTFSASPSWQTSSTLSDQYDGVAITLSLVAQEATSYTLVSGSLPPGLSLNASTGAITGTVTGVTVDTTYTFTVRATDAQNQDSPRTFTVTITVSDPYFNRTTLLLSGSAISANTVLRDSSTNNFNLTAYGDTRASNFSPYGTGWSAYFDGSGDSLSVASNAAFSIGTGDFTIEAWIYPISFGTYAYVFGTTAVGGLVFSKESTNFVIRAFNVGDQLQYATLPALNTWTHIAASRSGTTLRMFYNGVQVASTTNSYNFAQGTVYIGNENTNAAPWNGYISGFRLVKGTAVYTSNFTPPTQPLNAVTNTSLLTCQSNRFLDLSTNNFDITRNGDAKVTGFNPSGTTNTSTAGSAYFDGTGDYLTTPNNINLDLSGSINYTIEAWIYLTGYGSTADMSYAIANQFTSTGGSGYIYGVTGGGADQGKPRFYGAAGAVGLTASNVVPLNSWNHIAFVKNGTTYTHYLNGVSNGTTTIVGTVNTSSEVFGIGKYITSAYTDLFKGYICDLRIVKGTAVYTANFTPPTQPLTAIANTQLLTLQHNQPHNNYTFLDSSNNQYLITRNGNATQGSFSPFSTSGWSMFVGGAGYQRWDTNTNYSGTDLTIECWAYATATTTTYTSLISSNLGTGNYYPYFDLGIDGSNLLSCSFYGTSQVVCKNTTSFPLNAWVHCAVVLTSAGAVSLYQAGQRVATASSATIASVSTGIQVGGLVQTSGGGYTAYFNGYISNARIVKSAVYSGTTITVPTTALSAIANTNLLVCGENRAVDKANGYALGVNTVSRTAVAFSPFAPTAVYNPAVHGSSAYFDGSGDYLTIGSTSDFILGTNDFCLEAWHYSLTGTDVGFIARRTAQAATGWVMGVRSIAALLGGTWYDPLVGVKSSFKKYEWVHSVVTRSGNNWRFFENGVLIDYQTRSGSINDMTQYVVNIGRAASSAEEGPFTGYLTDAALTIGSIPTLYQTNVTTTNTQVFSVPTAPRTSSTNTNFLVKGTDAAIIDSTGRTVLETAADARSTNVVTKFTGGAMYFDGTGDYLVVPSSVLHLFGTQAFTVEAWVYTTTTKQYQNIYGTHNGDTNWVVRLLDNKIMMYTGSADITGATVLAINTWYHVAAVREGTGTNQTKLYVNGTLDVTGTNATNYTTQSQAWIGAQINNPGATYFQGYIADLRVTRGYARYTNNFTPPTGPHRLK